MIDLIQRRREMMGSGGNPLPYDAEALHSERQALRDRINELEGEP